MRDPRIDILAKNIIGYSVNLQAGEKILIEASGANEFVKALVEEVYRVGGMPFVELSDGEIDRVLNTGSSDERFKELARYLEYRMKDMQAWIGVRGSDNVSEMSGVPADRMAALSSLVFHPVHHNLRVKKTKWVVMRWPNHSMAQLADLPTQEFEDFFFQVCNLDYSKMSRAMNPLVDLMNKTDKVRITGKGTDLSFSIKDIPAIKCDGHMNIPDGEIYTAPVKESVNGVISYNTPAVYQGVTFTDVRLVFKDGKIVEATSNDTERINKIFDTDPGARYVGEFAIGVHPYIVKPMKDTLFDEKISGSIHFTPGSCYEDADNGNNSAIHWDLVFIQTPEYGGGEIYFDDKLVRKDGLFVLPELEGLNPENLK